VARRHAASSARPPARRSGRPTRNGISCPAVADRKRGTSESPASRDAREKNRPPYAYGVYPAGQRLNSSASHGERVPVASSCE
jgi:hypothetical protein